MEKLTQFVSKSFENNNNRPSVQNLLNLKTDKSNASQDENGKSNNKDVSEKKADDSGEEIATKQPKAAKNWLISNSPKPQNICTSYGMDLRINPNGYPLIFGSTVQPVCDIPQYSEQKCENEDRDKMTWYKDVKQPSSPKNCCCPAANEQDDSVESNYDTMTRTKVLSDNRSFVSDDDKNPGKLKIHFMSIVT